MIIEIPGVGSVEFPDGTAPEVIEKALEAYRQEAPAPNTNPGVSPDAPPDMVLNPNTGQYTSRELLANNHNAGRGQSALSGGAQGLTFGGADEALGAVNAVIPGAGTAAERYTFGRENARAIDDSAAENHPYIRGGAELAGGVTTAAAYSAPVMAGRGLGQQALLGGLLGGGEAFTYGALSADEDRLRAGAKAVPLGVGAGVAAPYLSAGLAAGGRMLTNPAGAGVSMITGRPSQTRANRALATTLERSGRSVDDVGAALRTAASEGQPDYMMADALGQAGQRRLGGITRSGGDASQEIAEYLQTRQMAQPERVAQATEEAFDLTGQTSRQVRSTVEAGRKRSADIDFGSIRSNGAPVDTRGVVDELDGIIEPFRTAGIEDEGLSYLEKLRRQLVNETGDVELSDFDKVFTIRKRLRDEIDTLFHVGRAEQAKDLLRIRKAFDEALSASSDQYRRAMDDFAASSRVMDAVDAGQTAGRPGQRAADTADEFGRLGADEQAGYRVGYGDRILARTESAAGPNTNRARPMTSPKMQSEAQAVAIDPGLYGRRIGRETEMFETFNRSLMGSRTADNMEDIADLGQYDAGMIVNALTGNFRSAGTQALQKGSNALSGMDPSTRQLVARALMSKDAGALRAAVAQAETATQKKAIVDALLRIGSTQAAN